MLEILVITWQSVRLYVCSLPTGKPLSNVTFTTSAILRHPYEDELRDSCQSRVLFFRLNFDVYNGRRHKELEREIRSREKKWDMLAATQGKINDSEKQTKKKANRHTQDISTITRR